MLTPTQNRPSDYNPEAVFEEHNLPGTPTDTFRCPCPVHGGEGYSFVYYGDIQRWKCFSHHCEDQYGSHLRGLINALSDAPAVRHHKPSTSRQSRYTPVTSDLDFTNRPNHAKYAPNPYIPYLIHRGFFSQTVKHFEAFVSHNKQHQLYNRIVLPVRDHNGQVVGFSGRSQNSDTTLKWCHYEFKSGEVIYNLHNTAGSDYIILVEGPFDVWRAWEAGIMACGALFGTNISRHQIYLLKKFGFKKVILCMDPDKAGGHATLKKNGIFDKLSDIESVYNIRHLLTDDLGDMTVDDIRKHICPEIQRIINEA